MIRAAICHPNPKARATLRQALETLASDAGAAPFAVLQYDGAAQALEELDTRRPGHCALLLCSPDLATPDDVQALSQMKEHLPQMRLVLMSADPARALQAFQVRADAFALMGKGSAEFAAAVGRQLREIALTRGDTITLKSKTGIDVLDANAILFAETSNGGPVIHLADGRDVQLRGTLQALFEQMNHDSRFTKAGGSFIVNLDNVRSAGKSSIVFPDGSVIIVPIRARKPFQEALESYRSR